MSGTNGKPTQNGGPIGGGYAVTRGATQLIRRMVSNGHLSSDVMPETVAFLRNVMNDPEASTRDRVRAAMTIRAIVGDGGDKAVYVHKCKRADAGKAPIDNSSAVLVLYADSPEGVRLRDDQAVRRDIG